MQRLIDPEYLAFPFRIEDGGPAIARRRDHIRQQIEQVLFVDPGERVFALDYGAGVRRMVFEPNSAALWAFAKQRLSSNLTEVLAGEVDPQSLDIQVGIEGEDTLAIRIQYRLAAINRTEDHRFEIQGGTLG